MTDVENFMTVQSTTIPTTQQPRPKKHFFDLPSEIRQLIYEHTFGSRYRVASCDPHFVPRSRWVSIRKSTPSAAANLTKVCKAIREEAIPVFNRSRVFWHKEDYPRLSQLWEGQAEAWSTWTRAWDKLQLSHVRDFRLSMQVTRMPESAIRPRPSHQQPMSDLSIFVSIDPHKCHVRCRERDPWMKVKLSPTSWDLIDSIIRETLSGWPGSAWDGLTLIEILSRIKVEQRRLLCLEILRRGDKRHDLIMAYSRNSKSEVEAHVVKEGFQRL